MGGREGDDEEEGPLPLPWVLGMTPRKGHTSEKVQGVPRNGIRVVIFGVVVPVPNPPPIPIQAVVVEAGVHEEPVPLVPAVGHVGPVVLVEVLPDVGRVVA